MLELPWDKCTLDKIDIKKAGALLDREPYGLQKVKERILELLAVRKLAPDIKGQIICLVGPAGRWQNINRAVDCKIDGT